MAKTKIRRYGREIAVFAVPGGWKATIDGRDVCITQSERLALAIAKNKARYESEKDDA